MEDLSGRVAVITGGASGIGLATAEVLAREGCRIVLADIEAASLEAAVAKIRETGVEAEGVVVDVADLASVQDLADASFDRFGKVHIVFNNAGVAVAGPVVEMKHEDWKWVIDVDLWGVIHGVEVFTRRLIDQGEGGHIVATSSFAGMVPNMGLGAYCVAKYGVVALMEVLQRELRGHGIGASVLCPMRVRTNIDASGRNRHAEYGGPESQQYPEVDEDRMAGRVVPVEDVGRLVVEGVKHNRLYLFPHEEARAFIRKRFDRIDTAFEV